MGSLGDSRQGTCQTWNHIAGLLLSPGHESGDQLALQVIEPDRFVQSPAGTLS